LLGHGHRILQTGLPVETAEDRLVTEGPVASAADSRQNTG
jgi:hypothetical protein